MTLVRKNKLFSSTILSYFCLGSLTPTMKDKKLGVNLYWGKNLQEVCSAPLNNRFKRTKASQRTPAIYITNTTYESISHYILIQYTILSQMPKIVPFALLALFCSFFNQLMQVQPQRRTFLNTTLQVASLQLGYQFLYMSKNAIEVHISLMHFPRRPIRHS